MKSFLLIVSGFILCLLAGLGFFTYEKAAHPLGALTNEGFPLIQVSQEHGNEHFDLKKGEFKLLKYGEYTISIPQLNTTFVLFKNNRGVCNVQLAKGTLLVEVNENARIFTSTEEPNTAEQGAAANP